MDQALLIAVSSPALGLELAHDRRLKDLCLLAGQQVLVVPRAQEKRFRAALRTCGYLLPGSAADGGGDGDVSGGTRPTLVTVDTYRVDALFPKVERAVLAILASGKVVTPVDVMVRIGWLSQEDLDAWRQGRVPYLEAVVQCNLTRLSRFLRVLRFYCHDLNLTGKPGEAPRRKGRKALALRFTKTGDPRIEAAYARRYVWPGKGPFPFSQVALRPAWLPGSSPAGS